MRMQRMTLSRRRTLAAFIWIASGIAAVALPLGAAAFAARQELHETTSVVAVEVPIQVTKDGQPVRGLSADDFELYDGRKRQAITGFEVVDLEVPAAAQAAPVVPTPAAPPALPSSSRRRFLLLFDLAYSEPVSIARARSAASDLVHKQLLPGDLVAVATYSATEGPKLFLGFTSDRRQVDYAIATLGRPRLVDRHPDPLGLIASSTAETGGRSTDTTPMAQEVQESLQDLANAEAGAARDTQANDLDSMSRALEDFAKLLGSVPGRKYVVYLSEGFDSSLLVGTDDPQAQRSLHEAVAHGQIVGLDNSIRFGRTKELNVVDGMLDAFRRSDCVIESFDIAGLRAPTDVSAGANPGARNPRTDSLFHLAKATGGELFQNTNDIAKTMSELARKTSLTYVLAFQPENLAADGRYHEIRVKLKDGRRGEVSYRPGYYAPRPWSARSAAERQLAAASLVLGSAGGRIPVAVLAAPFPVAGQKPYVPVVVQVGGPALLAGAKGAAVKADVYAYAMDEQGSVHDHFAQSLGLEVAKVRRTLEGGGLTLYGHFDLDPGRYLVRVLVRNAETGESTVAAAPLEVPAFERGEAALLPPLFPEPAGRSLALREGGGRDKLRDVPFPFRVGDRTFLPAARPAVRAGEPAAVLLLASGLGGGEPEVRGRVFAADGTARQAGELSLASRDAQAGGIAPGLSGVRAVFDPGSLPVGDYTLVVTLTDRATKRQLASSLPFAVVAAPAAAR